MNASIRYYEFRKVEILAKIVELRLEQARVEQERLDYEKATGVKKRELLGSKAIAGQIEYWQRQLESTKKTLLKRANAIKSWHDTNNMLDRLIAETKERILMREAEVSNLAVMISAGVKLQDFEINNYVSYGIYQNRDSRELKKLLNLKVKQAKTKPKESLKYALDIIANLDLADTINNTEKNNVHV